MGCVLMFVCSFTGVVVYCLGFWVRLVAGWRSGVCGVGSFCWCVWWLVVVCARGCLLVVDVLGLMVVCLWLNIVDWCLCVILCCLRLVVWVFALGVWFLVILLLGLLVLLIYGLRLSACCGVVFAVSFD